MRIPGEVVLMLCTRFCIWGCYHLIKNTKYKNTNIQKFKWANAHSTSGKVQCACPAGLFWCCAPPTHSALVDPGALIWTDSILLFSIWAWRQIVKNTTHNNIRYTNTNSTQYIHSFFSLPDDILFWTDSIHFCIWACFDDFHLFWG